MTTEANLKWIDSIKEASQQITKPKSGKGLSLKKPQFKPSKPCAKCGKQHPGRPCRQGMNVCYTCGEEGHRNWNCPKKGVVCFNCQQPGHMSRDCPKPRPAGQTQGLTQTLGAQQGRVFNLTRQDSAENPAVIQGTMFISGFPMHVLVDSGASHSFISHALAKILGKNQRIWIVAWL